MAEPTKPLLEQFRGSTKRLVIHPYERAALVIVGLQLVILPWALGGVRVWAQVPSLLFALLGFAIALLPRDYTEDHTGSERFRLIMWPKLVRFPLFWLGLALLAWVAISALNPAFQFETDGKTWWMKPIDHLKWLPASVRVPFERYGPWRLLLIYSTTWLVVCTVWVAFTRRRTLQLLFLAVAINGAILAAFGLVQRMLSNGKMFWVWKGTSSAYFASFIYKNHAGAYLDLVLATMCGLAGWYYLRGLRRLEKSNPAGLFAFFATCTSVAILVSYARGATLVMLAFLAVTVTAFGIHQLIMPNPNRKPIVAVVLILLFGSFLKTGLEALQSQLAWDRIEQALVREDTSLESRRIARTAAIEMLRDGWPKGTGSGSFRFLFPAYQLRHPEISYDAKQKRLYWEHAHDDPVEFTTELGLVGVLLLLGAAGYVTVHLIRNFVWQNPLSASLALGLALVLGYSWWDFPFQCPAILMLWWVLIAGAMMWTQMEELNLKG